MAATGCLIGAAEGRDFQRHARIGMMRALNRNVERVLFVCGSGSASRDCLMHLHDLR